MIDLHDNKVLLTKANIDSVFGPARRIVEELCRLKYRVEYFNLRGELPQNLFTELTDKIQDPNAGGATRRKQAEETKVKEALREGEKYTSLSSGFGNFMADLAAKTDPSDSSQAWYQDMADQAARRPVFGPSFEALYNKTLLGPLTHEEKAMINSTPRDNE